MEIISTPNYTHSIIPTDSVELLANEQPLVSQNKTQWLIRRVIEGAQLLTLAEVLELKLTPPWLDESAI